MYHIKKDQKFLCGKKPNKRQKEVFVSYSHAHQYSLTECCPLCKKKFDELTRSEE